MSDWLEVGRVSDIPELGARIIRRTGGPNIAVFRAKDDRIFALENRCAHKGGPLSEGIVHGCRVTCPLHNWVFDLETGSAVGPDEGEVPTYQVKVEKGVIFLNLASASKAAA